MSQAINQGIAAIQAGQYQQGIDLLVHGISDPTEPNRNKAVAYMWLAYTQRDPQYKLRCYRAAVELDPTNADAVRGLNQLEQIYNQPPPPPPPISPADTGMFPQPPIPGTGRLNPTHHPDYQRNMGDTNPLNSDPRRGTGPLNPAHHPDYQRNMGDTNPLNNDPRRETGPLNPLNLPEFNDSSTFDTRRRTGLLRSLDETGQMTGETRSFSSNPPQLWEFGVHGGPNGVGTAFLVVRDGLLVTTKRVVGTNTNVKLTTRSGEEFRGRVIRSYPDLDLAFIRVTLKVAYVRDFTPLSQVMPETMLVADDYTTRREQAKCRSTSRHIAPGWLPTTFGDTLPPSFNGAPLVDERDDLVGMLTRNADRNSRFLYGLHIAMIRRKIESFYYELEKDRHRKYCGICGNRSAAGANGLYYCEYCGGLFPEHIKAHRTPHPQSQMYYDVKRKKDDRP